MPHGKSLLDRSPKSRYDQELSEQVHPAGWQNPQPAGRYTLVVIGAGTAGLVAAQIAAALGAKVALLERHLLGGDCLNVGCVPSKAIIRSARLYAEMRRAADFGVWAPEDVQVDFPMLMERMRCIRARISYQDAAAKLTAAGIDVYFGAARFRAPDAIVVDGQTLRFKRALIATGSRPTVPSIPGLVEGGYLSNENVFDLTRLPRHLWVRRWWPAMPGR